LGFLWLRDASVIWNSSCSTHFQHGRRSTGSGGKSPKQQLWTRWGNYDEDGQTAYMSTCNAKSNCFQSPKSKPVCIRKQLQHIEKITCSLFHLTFFFHHAVLRKFSKLARITLISLYAYEEELSLVVEWIFPTRTDGLLWNEDSMAYLKFYNCIIVFIFLFSCFVIHTRPSYTTFCSWKPLVP